MNEDKRKELAKEISKKVKETEKVVPKEDLETVEKKIGGQTYKYPIIPNNNG